MKLVNSRMIWVKDQLDLPDRLESQETTDLKEILAPVDPKEMLDHQELTEHLASRDNQDHPDHQDAEAMVVATHTQAELKDHLE